MSVSFRCSYTLYFYLLRFLRGQVQPLQILMNKNKTKRDMSLPIPMLPLQKHMVLQDKSHRYSNLQGLSIALGPSNHRLLCLQQYHSHHTSRTSLNIILSQLILMYRFRQILNICKCKHIWFLHRHNNKVLFRSLSHQYSFLSQWQVHRC